MNVMHTLKLSLLVVAVSFLGGCTVGPNYKPPQVTVLNEWGEQGREPTTRPGSEAAATRPSVTVSRDVPLVEWWTTFHDPQLDDLIRRAANANLDLKRAESRVREARAQRAVIRSDLYPQLGTSASYTHARPSENGLLSAFGSGGGGGGVNVGGGGSPPAGSNGSAAIPGSQFSEFDLYQ